MRVGKLDKPLMRLLPGELGMEEDPDMTLFQLIHWNLKVRKNPNEEIWMTVDLKRKIMSEMMTTFLPSLLLMMITFATTFFKPFFFEAALTVNLTNMLVMTTIFISVMEKLPLTSYPKMIDIWLIICQLVPFSEVIPPFLIDHFAQLKVILMTAMENIRDSTEENYTGKGGIEVYSKCKISYKHTRPEISVPNIRVDFRRCKIWGHGKQHLALPLKDHRWAFSMGEKVII